MDRKNLLEAALYVAGRPLTLDELAKVIGEKEPERIRVFMEQLMADYQSRNGALEIVTIPKDRYVLQLKAAFSPKVNRLAPSGFLSSGALKILSLIGLKQPIPQSEVIAQRGLHSYQYVRELIEKDFISREPHKRTYLLRTTETFASYFGFPSDVTQLKLQLQRLLEKNGYLRVSPAAQPTQATLDETPK